MKYVIMSDWNIKERLELLEAAKIEFKVEQYVGNKMAIEYLWSLNASQSEVFNFVIDPEYVIDFKIFSNEIRLQTLALLTQYWTEHTKR